MPDKTILLYDSSNQPLRVAGIRVELFDVGTGALVDAKNSANLNPAAGQNSSEWGVVLTFTPGSSPLDILISDPLYRYPGNTLRYLNGDLQDQVFLDVLQLPPVPANQATPPSGNILDIITWVNGTEAWDDSEKDAVLNLVFNYARVITAHPERVQHSEGLVAVAANWEGALARVGIPAALFKRRQVARVASAGM
jgi:hypothetical protein